MISGIASAGRVLGHYLHDRIHGSSVVSSVAEARDGKRPPGLMGGGAFIPRFRNLKKDEKRYFIKGYCVIINSGGGAPPQPFAHGGGAARPETDVHALAIVPRHHLR